MKDNKRVSRAFVLLLFVLVNAGILFGIAQVIAYLNTGATREGMLQLDRAELSSYMPEVSWDTLANSKLNMTAAQIEKIEKDYLAAWFSRSRVLYSNDMSEVGTYHTQTAKEELANIVGGNLNNNVNQISTTLEHHLTLEFFSIDGTLAVLTDKNVKSYNRVFVEDALLTEGAENASFHVVLLLEDGFWRIRHIEKTFVEKTSSNLKNNVGLSSKLKGFNYYPKDSAWDTFGASFSEQTITADFDQIRALGMNTVRIFIGYEDFGKEYVSPTKLKKLVQLMDMAERADLKVIITLFDLYGDYSVFRWTANSTHLRTVVETIKDHKALQAWDIKNEPDLDFQNRGESLVMAWLSEMVYSIKKIDTTHPVTIGWSNAKQAMRLKKEVDFISFHYYDEIETLPNALNKLKESTQKPIVLQEIGRSSYKGIWNPFGQSEEHQRDYIDAFLQIQNETNLSYLMWTLHDFPQIPNSVVGRLPWRKARQKKFGVLNTDGQPKKVYSVFLEQN